MVERRMIMIMVALITLARVKLLLHLGGWPLLIRRLPAIPTRLSSERTDERIVDVCGIATRLFPFTTECLERSFMTCAMLRWNGFPAELHIGVSKVPPLRFHAWTALSGQVMNDSQSIVDLYRILYRQ